MITCSSTYYEINIDLKSYNQLIFNILKLSLFGEDLGEGT